MTGGGGGGCCSGNRNGEMWVCGYVILSRKADRIEYIL